MNHGPPLKEQIAVLVEECLADSDPDASDLPTAIRNAHALAQTLSPAASLEPEQERALLARAEETASDELRGILCRLLMVSALLRSDTAAIETLVGG